MTDRKVKKYPDEQSKSAGGSLRRVDHTKRHKFSQSKAAQRSRSRSHSSHKKKYRSHESPSGYHHSVESRQWSSPGCRNSLRSTRHRSRSPSPYNDSRRSDTFLAKPSRVLGVFGLSLYTDERILKEVFTQYGPVEDIQVILDHHSGISRGYAFVYMRHLRDAIQAKDLVPGTEIDGRKIRVDYSMTDFSPSSNAAGNTGQLALSSSHCIPPSSSTNSHRHETGLRSHRAH